MSKQVYISADYDPHDGDRDVADELNTWGQDNLHRVNFIDMSQVKSGSVSDEEDCRACDLKSEFNRQINASSAVVFVVGDKTASRTAGSECPRCGSLSSANCYCTPYKGNRNGSKPCKAIVVIDVGPTDDVGNVNKFSYLKHEFMQAVKKKKPIVILYNSMRKESSWLPNYMAGYEDIAIPFWKYSDTGRRIGDYSTIKTALGF